MTRDRNGTAVWYLFPFLRPHSINRKWALDVGRLLPQPATMSATISTSWALNLRKKQMTYLSTSRLQVRKHYTASQWHWTVCALY